MDCSECISYVVVGGGGFEFYWFECIGGLYNYKDEFWKCMWLLVNSGFFMIYV